MPYFAVNRVTGNPLRVHTRTRRRGPEGPLPVAGLRRPWMAGPGAGSSVAGGLGQLDGRRREALDAVERQALRVRRVGIVLDVDHDDLAGAEVLEEQALGDRVFHHALDGPAQRSGTEGRVVALLAQEELRGLGD